MRLPQQDPVEILSFISELACAYRTWLRSYSLAEKAVRLMATTDAQVLMIRDQPGQLKQ